MIKKIFITLGILILLLILGTVVFFLTFDLNHYRNFVVAQVSNALGRPVEIRSMSAKLSLIPTINVEGVRILDTNQKEPLLEIPKLEAVIELTPLVQGQIVVQKITVPEASVIWNQPLQKETDPASDSKNENKANKSAAKNVSKIWLESVSIDALHIKVNATKEYKFDINKFALNQLSKFSFDFVYQGKTVAVSGNFGSVLELIQGATNLPVNLTLSQERANLRINGRIAELATLEKMNFQITANIPNLKDFMKKWEIQNNKIPPVNVALKTSFEGDLKKATIGKTSLTLGKDDLVIGAQGTLAELKARPTADLTTTLSLKNGSVSKLLGIKPLELSSKITASKGEITFSDIRLNAGRSDVSGKMQIQINKTPLFIKGELNSAYFDVDDIKLTDKHLDGQKKVPEQKSFVLSKEPLPFDLLDKVDSNVALNVTHLKLSKEMTDYADLKTAINLEKGMLNMPIQIGIFGGTVQNSLKIQANKKEVFLETKANYIQVNKIKGLNKNVQNTNIYWAATLKSKGASLHELAEKMEGNISAELTEGYIVNKWFNSLPATLDLLRRGNLLAFSTQDQKTELICGALNVPVKNGVITSQDQIALETNTLNFAVNGRIDLKNETLDLAMIPSVSQTRGMANAVLDTVKSVRLYGSWMDIKTKVDTAEMLGNLLNVAQKQLTGQTSEKQNVLPKALCQKVLGRNLTQKANGVQKVQPKTEQKSDAVQTKTQPNLRQQLIQSLSQVLTDQGTAEKK